MREAEAAWLQWRATGQAAYLAELAKVDADYAKLLQVMPYSYGPYSYDH